MTSTSLIRWTPSGIGVAYTVHDDGRYQAFTIAPESGKVIETESGRIKSGLSSDEVVETLYARGWQIWTLAEGAR